MSKKSKNTIWNFIENMEGDKVIWMIFLLLIMTSMLTVFSSTSLLALQQRSTRIEIIQKQGIIVACCVIAVFVLYKIKDIRFFRFFGRFGFWISVFFLSLLAFNVRFGDNIGAQHINEAWRSFGIFGIQVHVFEIVKVFMVLYIAWAVYAYNKDQLWFANWLGSKKHFKFMKTPLAKKILYIYLPIIIVLPIVLKGSNSSAVLIAGTLMATLLVSGIPKKEILLIGLIAVLLFFAALFIYQKSDGKYLSFFERIELIFTRVGKKDNIEELKEYKPGSEEFYQFLGKIRQPEAAKIAIHEGGLLGKGPGGSTQKYSVAVIFGDYMYSFILEEYGLWGGILIIILYVSLLARGSLVARMCDDDDFAKTAIGGLTILITSQAFLHMLVNIDIGLVTGQTLPIISHGNSALVMFCFAFGVILSISRIAKKNMLKQEAMAEPIYTGDEVQDRLHDLDRLESI